MNDPYKTPANKTGSTPENNPKVEFNYSALVPIAIGMFVTIMTSIHVQNRLEVGPLYTLPNMAIIMNAMLLLILVWTVISVLLFLVPAWRAYSKFIAPVPVFLVSVFVFLHLTW